MIDEDRLRNHLLELLEESDPNRELDSLEMMMVYLALEGLGLSSALTAPPCERTILGWIKCIQMPFGGR